jgi:hypothetical protein
MEPINTPAPRKRTTRNHRGGEEVAPTFEGTYALAHNTTYRTASGVPSASMGGARRLDRAAASFRVAV